MAIRRSLSALALLLAGCFFPHWEVWRPDYVGVVADASGAVVPGVRVASCSTSKWVGLRESCERAGQATTGSDGAFHFARVRELEYLIAGEAPLPFTVAIACGADGRVAVQRVREDNPVRLVLETPPVNVDARSDLEFAVAQCRRGGFRPAAR